MKSKIFTIFLLMVLMGSLKSIAQSIDVPVTGVSLNEFISANHGEGGKTFLLARNGYYVLTGSIAVTGDITIAAKDGEGARPVIVMGTNAEGGSNAWGMFYLNGNITFRDLHLSGSNDLGGRGAWNNAMLANAGADKTVTIDNCIIDFSDGYMLATENNPIQRLNFTNNLIRWNGYIGGGPWQGFGVIYKSGAVNDVFMENNSWVECIAPIFTHENSLLGKFWFNHNTIISHAQYLMRAEYWTEAIFMNNLFVDAHFAGESLNQRIGQDPDTLAYGVINVGTYINDTLVPAGFPEEEDRAILFAYNANYVSPGVKDYWNNANTFFTAEQDWQVADYTKGDNGFLNSRSLAKMNDDAAYPYLMWDDQLSVFTEDPGLVNYTFDNENPILFGRRINGDETAATVSTEAGNWGIHPSSEFPMEPVAVNHHNLAYTNTYYQKAGYEGYPLGDLNWFPTRKAEWEADANKETFEEIMAAVKAGTFEFTNWGTVNVSNVANSPVALGQNYPNPANAYTNIEFSLNKPSTVKILLISLIGQTVKVLVNESLQEGDYEMQFDLSDVPAGMYFYQLETPDASISRKMHIVK